MHVPGAPYHVYEGVQPPTGPFRSDYVEILAVISGSGRRTFRRPDGSLGVDTLAAGQILLFRPTDVHEIAADGSEELAVCSVAFPFPAWERFLAAADIDARRFTTLRPPAITYDLTDPEALAPFRLARERFWSSPTAIDLLAFLVAVVPRFVATSAEDSSQGVPEWLWAAVLAMNEEPNLREGVPRLAEIAHVSPAHLWRSTRRYFGFTPGELVLDIRLNRAAILLNSTDDEITTVAWKSGFSSPSYFSKAFRRRHGVTPREYRATSRDGFSPAGS
jgi:AraC-like DNA-binding protein